MKESNSYIAVDVKLLIYTLKLLIIVKAIKWIPQIYLRTCSPPFVHNSIIKSWTLANAIRK